MKHLKTQFAILLLSTLCLMTSAYGQITPLGDAYTNTADPTTNYGAKTLLDVDGATQITYIQFNLASIPTGASVSQATLKLYVNSVAKAGSFNVDYVDGTWSEATIDASNAPPLGNTIAANVAITTADKNQYILINVTPAVQAWLNGSQTNDGIALAANSTFNAIFDSKENTTTSHPAELDIAYAGGDGTITGVTTASGSGLMGGGTSGTLNLSLTDACAANQVLQWNGSAWACASMGTGTITGVAAGTDLTGGGTSGSVTLNLDTTKVPQLAAANTFTANQTVKGNLSATGVVTGNSYQIGSNLFAFGNYANQNALLGFAGNSAITGAQNTASGYQALASTTTGYDNTANGYQALTSNTGGFYNTASGNGALFSNTNGSSNSAYGSSALQSNTTGIYNTASGSQALQNTTSGYNNTADGSSALFYTTTGNDNTAVGLYALYLNTGALNTASGSHALYFNASGGYNSALGYFAGQTVDDSAITGSYNTAVGANAALGTGTLTNATAIGSNAEVQESNALVLGSIKNENGASASVAVGIGTTFPGATLDVRDNGSGANTFAATTARVNNAVYGSNTATSGSGANGGFFTTASPQGAGIVAQNTGSSGVAGYFNGNVYITGSLTKSSGTFKIDHPLDPANKYLYHSFVESPDMMNIYNGIATLNAGGCVWITLPAYFEALNQDFRYQLTSIGRPQPSLYVAREISGNRFRISGGKPGGKVSWQVTGVRHDAYANAHRIQVEVKKPPQEQGRYLHPELFGAPAEQAIGYAAPPNALQAEGDHLALLQEQH
jgi:hypothetical protein